jgi:hypothetical protein
VVHAVAVATPPLPVPEASAMDVPAPSSNPYAATRPSEGGSVVVVVAPNTVDVVVGGSVEVVEDVVVVLDEVVEVGGVGPPATHSPSPATPLCSVATLPPVASAIAVPVPSSSRSDSIRDGVFPGSVSKRKSAISCAVRATLHTRMSSIWPENPGWTPCFSAPNTSVGSSGAVPLPFG